jgi:hypothetical protein
VELLIGQAALKSAAFCPRLTLLVADFREAGYTVWLEGTDLRFDADQTLVRTEDLNDLKARYRDIIDWGPTVFAEAAPAPAATLPRWLQLLSGRGAERVKPG